MDPVIQKMEQLLASCEARGIVVSDDGYVAEADAATLLRKSRYTLRNRRLGDCPIPFRRHGRGAEYQLLDLAQFLLAGEDL